MTTYSIQTLKRLNSPSQLYEGSSSSKIDLTKWNEVKLSPETMKGFGNSFFGSTFQSRSFHTSPGVITKILKLTSQEDSQIEFFKILTKNSNNPLVPRIHSAQLYKHGNSNFFMVSKVEQLSPLITSDVHSLSMRVSVDSTFIETALRNVGIDVSYQMASEESTRKKLLEISLLEALKLFIFSQKDEVHYRHKSVFGVVYELKNRTISKFRSVANSLKSIGWELNDNSLMVRLSGNGPQLVLVNPFVERI